MRSAATLDGVSMHSSRTGNPSVRNFAACCAGGWALPLVNTTKGNERRASSSATRPLPAGFHSCPRTGRSTAASRPDRTSVPSSVSAPRFAEFGSSHGLCAGRAVPSKHQPHSRLVDRDVVEVAASREFSDDIEHGTDGGIVVPPCGPAAAIASTCPPGIVARSRNSSSLRRGPKRRRSSSRLAISGSARNSRVRGSDSMRSITWFAIAPLAGRIGRSRT